MVSHRLYAVLFTSLDDPAITNVTTILPEKNNNRTMIYFT